MLIRINLVEIQYKVFLNKNAIYCLSYMFKKILYSCYYLVLHNIFCSICVV